MAITVSAISALVARYKNDIVVKQANLECPLLESGALPKLNKADRVGVVNIKAGGLTATGAVADGGALPTGGSKLPDQGTYLPIAFVTRLAIPRVAASLAQKTEDGIDLVFEQMETAGRDLGRFRGRAIFGSDVYTFVAADDKDATDDSFTVLDPSGFRVGNNYDVYDGATLLDTVQVIGITIPSGGGAATITIHADDTPGATWDAGDKVFLQGTKTNAMVSFNDVADATGNVYTGLSYLTDEWQGNAKTSAGSYSTSMHKDMITLITRRRGKKPSHTIVNSFGEQLIAEAHTGQRRYSSGKMDEFGLSLEFDGRPVLTDENCGDTDIYLHQKEDLKLHVFREFGPDVDGGKKAGMNRGSILVDDTNLEYDVQIWGAFNLRVQRRNGCGRISGVTA